MLIYTVIRFEEQSCWVLLSACAFYQEEKERARWEGGGGGEGEGQGKGQGILMGQLIGEQCNSPLIQSTLHVPLRQSKLFAPFLCNYFKQFCALILLRKELI